MTAEVDRVIAEAQNLIVKVFPERMATFKRLLASPEFCGQNDISDLPKESPQDILAGGNATVRRQINILTPHFCQMEADFQLLKLWLRYMIPKIEDGNNFGVSVIEEKIEEMKSRIEHSKGFLACPVVWCEDRAKAVQKAMKYPLVPDYKVAVQELDEYHLQRLRNYAQDLHRHYMLTYDVLIKNIDRIANPRGGCTKSSVYG